MSSKTQHIVYCGGLPPAKGAKSKKGLRIHSFNHDPSDRGQNAKIDLPHLLQNVGCHFSDRSKDLLEIAAYVYASDRMISRGTPVQLEYENWSRDLTFHVPVRDVEFWKGQEVNAKLTALLRFMTGDKSYKFIFSKKKHEVGQVSVFDHPEIKISGHEEHVVALFSGGLDSLAGALSVLHGTNKKLILVSHRSSNTRITQLQDTISKAIKRDFPDRVQYYPFYCSLTGERAVEETQRSRSFLYTTIAYAIARAFGIDRLTVFENGVTSLNFSKRQDLMNGRASRTTHPRTIQLLGEMFSAIEGPAFAIDHPFVDMTKTDVMNVIKEAGKLNYINQTITCTRTFQTFENESQATHCGCCSQCVDRRLAAFGSGLQDHDAIYDRDLSKDIIDNEEGKAQLCDYLHQVSRFKKTTMLSFQQDFSSDLIDIVPYMRGGGADPQKVAIVYELVKKHGSQIELAIQNIRSTAAVFTRSKPSTLEQQLHNQVFDRTPADRLSEAIAIKLQLALPIAMQRQRPKNENALNDFVQALLLSEEQKWHREYPHVRFGTGTTIPDHGTVHDLCIESKYLKTQAVSTITDQLSADLDKYKPRHILFVLYDPDRRIADEKTFTDAYLIHRNVRIAFIR